MPEWVHVWFWLRFLRNPSVLIPLPQQEHDDPMAMSAEEYELLRQEWLTSGSPRTSAQQVLAAMGALHEPVPF